MKPLAIGGIRVETIVETASYPIPFRHLVPAVTPEALAEHAAWLEPRFADVARAAGLLSFQSYLVRTPRHVILVDGCAGNDKERNGFAPFHRLRTDWLDRLRAAGVAPEQVDYEMCTHLHSDHVGWNTRLVDGRWVPTFPRAKYVFARREYEHRAAIRANTPEDRDGASLSFADSILPVVEHGLAQIVEGDWALDDHVALEPAEGHTPGHVIVHLRSRGAHGVCSGDVIHHPIQVAYPEWSAAFCEDPVKSAAFRRAFVERYADTPTIVMPAHFPPPTAGRIRRAGARYAFEFLE